MTITTPQGGLLDRFVEGGRALYSLPAVALEVLDLTAAPQVDLKALKACIENDPALTGKILRVVNSSLFGLSREVADLGQALGLLGTKPLKLLVLGFSLSSVPTGHVTAYLLGKYWRRTLTRAVAAREISESLWKIPGDEPFIAALLQDLGTLVLVQELGESYAQVVERTERAGADLASVEHTAWGFSHVELSARLLETWGLPDWLIAVIQTSGRPEQFSRLAPFARTAAQTLYLASLVADILVDGQLDKLPLLFAASEAANRLDRAKLTELVERLDEKVRSLAEVLSLALPDGVDYRDVLVQAHARMAAVAVDAAGDLADAERRSSGLDERLLQEVQCLSLAAAQLAGRKAPRPASLAANGRSSTAAAATGTAARGAKTARPAAPLPPSAQMQLRSRLESVAAAARQARCPLSLLIVELDRIDEMFLRIGPVATEGIIATLAEACRRLDAPESFCVQTRTAQFALVLPDFDRRQAVELGHQLLDSLGGFLRNTERDDDGSGALPISIGVASVALPPKNFRAEDLQAAAERCQFAAQAAGGNVVKSIEVY